jgi:hypothetical protein
MNSNPIILCCTVTWQTSPKISKVIEEGWKGRKKIDKEKKFWKVRRCVGQKNIWVG